MLKRCSIIAVSMAISTMAMRMPRQRRGPALNTGKVYCEGAVSPVSQRSGSNLPALGHRLLGEWESAFFAMLPCAID